MQIELTRSERDMLLTCLLSLKATGDYYGNRKVYFRRLNRLIGKLDERRRYDPATTPPDEVRGEDHP